MGLTIKSGAGKKIAPASEFDQHLVATPIKANTQVTKKAGVDGVEQVIKDEETILHPGLVLSKEEMLMVTVGGGTTIATAPYENVKLYISVSAPTTKPDLEQTFSWVSDWVSSKIEESVKQIKG